MVFRPKRLVGLFIGLSITAGQIALAFFLGYQLLRTPISLVSFGMAISILFLMGGTLLFGFWSYACWSLRYVLDRSHLAIIWGLTRHVIPLHQIQGLVHGKSVKQRAKIKGINWFGYHVGYGQLKRFGNTLFYSVHRSLDELVYVITPGIAFAISVPDPNKFHQEFKLCQRLGPVRTAVPVPRLGGYLLHPIWADRAAQALIFSAMVFNVALFGYVSYAFPSLPQTMRLSFTALGEVSRLGPKIEVFELPAMALLLLLLNLVLALWLQTRERLATYLALSGAILLQVLFAAAIIRLVGQG